MAKKVNVATDVAEVIPPEQGTLDVMLEQSLETNRKPFVSVKGFVAPVTSRDPSDRYRRFQVVINNDVVGYAKEHKYKTNSWSETTLGAVYLNFQTRNEDGDVIQSSGYPEEQLVFTSDFPITEEGAKSARTKVNEFLTNLARAKFKDPSFVPDCAAIVNHHVFA